MSKRPLLVAVAAMSAVLALAAAPGRPAVGASALTTQAASSAQTAGADMPAAKPISWGRCAASSLRAANAQCGYLSVPMDYGNPGGRQIKIALSRIKHSTGTSQGAMLVNPGGPGASGLELAALGYAMPEGSGAGYDWIGFDPRGVGRSTPRLSCRPSYFHGRRPPYVPTNREQEQSWLHRSKSYADACRKNGALLDHMKTTDTVRDIDRIREALGVEQISYYGYSYGTYLGQVYATLFPSHVRRMVLDSNVDPARTPYAAGLDQGIAFDRVFDRFFTWVAEHDSTYHLGSTRAAVQGLYLRQRQVLRRDPAGPIGPSELDDAFLLGGYVEALWPRLARGFSAVVHRHDAKALIPLWRIQDTPGDDNEFAVFNAVECTDAPSPARWSRWARDTRQLDRASFLFAWGSTWNSAPCLYWPARPGNPVTVDGHEVAALLVGQTLDGATPFEGSLGVRSRFPGSRLVAIRGGTTHASTPTLSGTCANARIAAYLRTGALPPRLPGRRADVTCPAPPPPSP